jgi:DNA (cytosine-5)-methyltransferase 1
MVMNELALFAGAGGGILGGKLLGWRTVCAVEWEAYPASVLCARQNDGLLPPFPVWDDVQTFDGKPWRGIVDVVSGGFPCQDLSTAKWGGGAGLDGERSGLWKEMGRIIGEVRPRFVFVENSPMLVNNGLDRVLADLSKLGFDARWGIVGADFVGAPHRRERFWLVAHSNSDRLYDGSNKRHNLHGQTICEKKPQNWHGVWSKANECLSTDDWKTFATEFYGMDDGMASRLDRIKACGNGQVPEVAATAWRILSEQ